MKNPKILYILISAFCIFAVIAGVYVEFVVKKKGDNQNEIGSSNTPNSNNTVVTQKTQEELKTQLASLFTNMIMPYNYDISNIQKLDDSKDIIYTAHHIEKNEENYEMNISLPVVNIKGEVASSFNNITQTIFANKASEILSGQSMNKTIYSVNYVAFINQNVLSVVIQSTLKEGSNPQRVIVQTYNYDLQTGQSVQLTDMLTHKNIIQSDAQKQINETVTKAQEQAQALVQSGYTVYNRNLSNQMYQLANISTYFLGPNGNLYIIFAYGNQNFTSDMDIIFYE